MPRIHCCLYRQSLSDILLSGSNRQFPLDLYEGIPRGTYGYKSVYVQLRRLPRRVPRLQPNFAERRGQAT
jgi:hypothetical protein